MFAVAVVVQCPSDSPRQEAMLLPVVVAIIPTLTYASMRF
jgi:hypothetical protein